MTSSYVFDVTEADFVQQVMEASMQQPVLVDFWASWCQPCQVLKPILEKLADDYQGKFLLAKINTEDNQNIAMQLQIRSIPTIKLFKNGEVVDEFMGAIPETEIRAFLDRHIPRESDSLVDQAEDLLSLGEAEAALELIKQANQVDPNNVHALVVYAGISVSMGNIDEARNVIAALPAEVQETPEVIALLAKIEFNTLAQEGDSAEVLLARLASNPDDNESRYQLAARQMAAGESGEALENLLTIMKKDRTFKEDAARKMMFRIFDTLGEHPLASTYRRKIMSLMY